MNKIDLINAAKANSHKGYTWKFASCIAAENSAKQGNS